MTNKNEAASINSITIEFDGKIPEKGVEKLDFCTVLSNTLDNKISGCMACAPCSVSVCSCVNANGLVMCVESPVNKPVHIVKNEIKTTKTDEENHGIGIGNIKSVAKKI